MGLFTSLAQYLLNKLKSARESNILATQPIQIQKPTLSQADNIPDIARQRLNLQKQVSQNFFTSDFTCNEYLLTREVGFEPIGVVIGTSFYKVGFYGYFRGFRNYTGELEALTQAQLAARELAISRMQSEAAMLGAHGIIGVRLKQSRHSWGTGMVEFTAIGTAIRIPHRPLDPQPFTSDLSGQEFWKLYQAGYYPKGIVFGACSYYVHSDAQTRAITNPSFWNRLLRTGRWRLNQEMIQFSEGFNAARELAIERLDIEAREVEAEGTVGMHIEMDVEQIVYQSASHLLNLLNGLLFMSISFFVFVLTMKNPEFMTMIIPIMMGCFFIYALVTSFISSFSSQGPYRDVIAHFVAVGTAIVQAKNTQNPVSKTLMFYPLSKI
ncbi:heavy metal-binding domain-containing protein [Iningainema tapete]|uniref:YbjQ family protein n=1 Tax=Iningainema tapete BLCC-T55 TaxID=2748662 RepID=A0A8J6XI96_9CYAN|nr:YbjQ family protein [Iningainema tapete]MBD2773755.1 YbjQ family protein [Iningainema tapete BLCC-T55]